MSSSLRIQKIDYNTPGLVAYYYICHPPICTKHQPIKTIVFDHVITNSGGNFNNNTEALYPCVFFHITVFMLL